MRMTLKTPDRTAAQRREFGCAGFFGTLDSLSAPVPGGGR
jgi:hypothetical protein